MRFSDSKGREWAIGFTCRQVRMLDRELGLKSLDFAGQLWPAVNSTERLVDIVWCLVRDEAERRAVPMEDFLEALNEKALVAARDCLLREYIAFFQSPTKQSLLERLLSEMRTLQAVIERGIRTRLEALATPTSGGPSSAVQAPSA